MLLKPSGANLFLTANFDELKFRKDKTNIYLEPEAKGLGTTFRYPEITPYHGGRSGMSVVFCKEAQNILHYVVYEGSDN